MMDPNYSKPIIVSNSAEPGTPDVGMSYLYVDSSGVVSTKGSNGQVIKSIGGSTGATDNAILRADGTGGATLQNSGMTIDDTNLLSGISRIFIPVSGGTSFVGSRGLSLHNVNNSFSNISARVAHVSWNTLAIDGNAVLLNSNSTGRVEINALNMQDSQLNVRVQTAARVGVAVRGAASQTGNLQEWQNSSGTVLTSVDSGGRITVPEGAFNDVSLRLGSAANGFSVQSNGIWITASSQSVAYLTGSRFSIRQSSPISWSSNASVINNNGDTGIARNVAGVLEVNNGTAGTFRDLIVRNLRMSAPTLVPASASATGSEGQVAWDADYIYICTATDTWKRVAIATW